MSKKYVAPEFAAGHTPRKASSAPKYKPGKLNRHNPVPLMPSTPRVERPR
jgi:hypothetical protein